MKIEVLQTGGEWVMNRLSKKFAEVIPQGDGNGKRIIFFSLYNMVPDAKFDNTYYTALFTHNGNDAYTLRYAERCDYIFTMNKDFENWFRERGFQNVKTITIPPEPHFQCRLVLAWVGHFADAKRKGKDLYEKVKELPWVKLIHPKDMPFNSLPEVYESCDYLLCTSNKEGGPLPLVEALACGKKVIIPAEIGNARLFIGGIIPYYNSNWDSLLGVLVSCYEEKKMIADLVKNYTWDKFKKDVMEVFHEIEGW